MDALKDFKNSLSIKKGQLKVYAVSIFVIIATRLRGLDV